MNDRSLSVTITVIALLAFTLTGCGQMGQLTLPDETADGEEEQSDEENER